MRQAVFIVPGTPRGKGRPRFVRQTGRTYTDDKTASYENLVKLAFSQKYPDWVPLDGPVSAQIFADFVPPKSTPKKKLKAMLEDGIGIAYTKKPDCDNIAKVILDSLNGIAYSDDSQIYSLTVIKNYEGTAKTKVVLSFETED